MIVGAASIAVLECVLYLIARRHTARFLTALPRSVTDGLPNRYALFGQITYSFAVRRLLATPAVNPSTERLRKRAAWWQRWWPWIGMALFFPVVWLGTIIAAALGIGAFQPPSFQDARLVIYGVVVAGGAIWIGRVLWRRRTLDIRRR